MYTERERAYTYSAPVSTHHLISQCTQTNPEVLPSWQIICYTVICLLLYHWIITAMNHHRHTLYVCMVSLITPGCSVQVPILPTSCIPEGSSLLHPTLCRTYHLSLQFQIQWESQHSPVASSPPCDQWRSGLEISTYMCVEKVLCG